MSTQASRSSSDSEAPLYRKPRADVFTVLLVIAMLNLILAATVLWLVMKDYEYKITGAPSLSWNAPSGQHAYVSGDDTFAPQNV